MSYLYLKFKWGHQFQCSEGESILVSSPCTFLLRIFEIRRRTSIDICIKNFGLADIETALSHSFVSPDDTLIREIKRNSKSIGVYDKGGTYLEDSQHQSPIGFGHKAERRHIVQKVHHEATRRTVCVRSTEHHIFHLIDTPVTALQPLHHLFDRGIQREKDVFFHPKPRRVTGENTYISFQRMRDHGTVHTNENHTFHIVVDDECSRKLPQV